MTPPNLGRVHLATAVATTRFTPPQIRTTILLLAGSVALMMTGFGIIMPVFARRLAAFGDGVAALGIMTTAFALIAPLGRSFEAARPVFERFVGGFTTDAS